MPAPGCSAVLVGVPGSADVYLVSVALWKSRPRIRLMAPGHAHAGQECKVEVLLDAKRAVGVDSVAIELEGEERVVVGSGKHAVAYRRPLLRQGATLCSAREIAKGRTTFPCVFRLPQDLPASYAGKTARVEYTMAVHAAIPWWPDAKQQFVLAVEDKPASAPDLGPELHTTRASGPVGAEPHLEFSVSSTLLSPGDTLRGEVALFNVAHNHYKALVLSLVAYETRRSDDGSPRGTVEAVRYSIELRAGANGEGEAIPFAMALPDRLHPTTQSQLFDLGWAFEMEAQLGWGRKLARSVAVRVLPRGSRKTAARRLAPPVVGSARVAGVWLNVAEEHGLVFDSERRAIVGREADSELVVERAHRGSDGIFLSGQLRYACLGLALDGGIKSGLRRIVGGGAAVGDSEWDRRHYIAGREEAQIHGFVRALGTALTSVAIADIDDEHAVAELRDNGQSRAQLSRFVAQVKSLARRIARARRLVPPPAAMADALPSWTRLASRLRGELDTCSMSVRGELDGCPAGVETSWSCHDHVRPDQTSLWIEIPGGVEERHRLAWTEDAYTSGDPDKLPSGAQKKLAAVVSGTPALVIAEDRITMWCPAPLIDASPAEILLSELLLLASALRGAGGPYR